MLSRKHFFAVSISTSENYDSCKGIVHKMKFLESLTLVLGRFPKVRTGRPDQTFWQRNRIFSRGFAEKPSPLCIIFRIWLIWMVSFNQKWNSYYDGNGLAGQFWQMESALSQSNLFKYNKQVKNNYFHLPSEEHGTKDIIPHPGLWHTVFVLQWLGNRNCDKFLKYPRITQNYRRPHRAQFCEHKWATAQVQNRTKIYCNQFTRHLLPFN